MSVQQHEQDFGETSRLPNILDRRRDQRSSSTQNSSRAVSLEIAMQQNLALEEHLERVAASEPPKQSLKRLLSMKSVVSTHSSFAERQRAATGTEVAFREIGTGSIAKVFEHPGTVWAYKLPIIDDVSKLWNNYIMNRRIENSFEKLGPLAGEVEVPHAIWYATDSTSDFWDANIDRFLFTREFKRQRRHVLCIERIFPLPKPTRYSLIDMYCPEDGRESAKSHAANKDCLLRPLLGRKRQSTSSKLNSFSLRNFKLNFDQIKEIGLDAQNLAFAMADVLAVLHWHTKVDAMDVEFVLGSSPQEDQRVRRNIPLETIITSDAPKSTFEYVTNSNANFTKRVTTLWLLDFDACSDITMDQAGVNMACKAFIETDPYFPRPHSSDPLAQQLWIDFGHRYIATASKVVNQGCKDMPVEFLRAVFKVLGPQSMPRPLSATIAYTPGRGRGQYSQSGNEGRGRPSITSRPNVSLPQSFPGGVRSFGFGVAGSLRHGRTGQSRADDHGDNTPRREDGQRGSDLYTSEGDSRRLDGPWRR